MTRVGTARHGSTRTGSTRAATVRAHGLGTFRAFRPTILVAGLATAFGTVLVVAPGIVATALHATGFDEFQTVQTILSVVGWVFLAVAIYVGAIVTANTCSTIIAGETRVLALQRLVGATGASLRAGITRSGLVVGAVGAVAGAVVGVALSAVVVQVLLARDFLPSATYDVVPFGIALPMVAVVLATWGAFAVGSGRVLTVAPLQALSSVVEPSAADVRSGRGRTVTAIVLIVVGAALLLLGVALSPSGALSVLPAALGGFVSFAGIVVGATLVMPPILAALGRIGAGDPVVLLAGRNALRAPGRTSRAVIGLVIGVTLLVTFSVALGILQHLTQVSIQDMTSQAGGGAVSQQQLDSENAFFAQLNAVVTGLVGFSAVIAAVGVVNALALGVLQRRRELGLLRVLGFTAAQVRRMIVTEAVQMVAAAVVFGTALGVLYGWVAGVTLLGQLGYPVTPVLPWGTVAVVVGGALLLAVVSTVAPVRSAMRVPPTQALAVD